MRELRWGMIGAGSIASGRGGRALCEAPHSRLVAIAGRSIEKVRACAEMHQVERCHASTEDLFADSDVDAIYIATPPDVHAEYAVKAADAGKHVLCEKPMALTETECREMIAACERNSVQLMVAYYRRFYPVIKKMMGILQSGSLGEPVYARVLSTAMYSGRATWKTDARVGGGGYLPDNGSHRLDLLTHLLGEVAEVTAFIGANYHSIQADDSAAIALRFKNKAYATAQFSWNAAVRTDEFEIGGSAGRMICRNLEHGRLHLALGDSVEEIALPAPPNGHVPVVAELAESVLDSRPNCLPGREGIKATRIILAAQRSAREGRAVTL